MKLSGLAERLKCDTELKDVQNNQIKLTPYPKGQLISKPIYGLLTSSKKRSDEFDLFAFLTLHGEQIKFVRSFFGRIYGSPICFLKLSNL